MRRQFMLIGVCLSAAACFAPRYPEGSLCVDECPGDLSCVDGRCVRGGADGEPEAGIDADLDGPPVACPSGYLPNAITGSSYRVVGTPATQAAAAADCADDGPSAYLAIPGDSNENGVLDGLANEDTWLGITDVAMEGIWRTVLGTIHAYLPWDPGTGQPNGGMTENCAFMSDRVWQDASCTIVKPYVCECR